MTSPVDTQNTGGPPEGDSPMAAIAALMQERARFEGWLSSLESRRTATPTHVFERVHGDYSRRLQHVLDQISSRASDLQQTRDALRGRLASLQSEEAARRDERAEAELRAMVGEFTDEQWAEVSSRSDNDIGRLVRQRDEVAAELNRVEEILGIAASHRPSSAPSRPPTGDVQRPSLEIAEVTQQEAARSAATAPTASPQPAASGAEPARPQPQPPEQSPGLADVPDEQLGGIFAPSQAAQSAAPAETAGATAGAASANEDFDELAFLKSVIEPPRDEPQRSELRPGSSQRVDDGGMFGATPLSSPAVGSGAPAGGGGGNTGSPFDLGVGESDARLSASSLRGFADQQQQQQQQADAGGSRGGAGGGMGAPGSTGRQTSPALHRVVTPESSPAMDAGGSRPREEAPPPPRRPTFESMPSILRGMQPVQEKTLRCQECGTMNYPTEWYCEKCGGELAAM